MEVWNLLNTKYNTNLLNCSSNSFQDQLKSWLDIPPYSWRLIPLITLWFIWFARNSNKHQNELRSPLKIVLQIQNAIHCCCFSASLHSVLLPGSQTQQPSSGSLPFPQPVLLPGSQPQQPNSGSAFQLQQTGTSIGCRSVLLPAPQPQQLITKQPFSAFQLQHTYSTRTPYVKCINWQPPLDDFLKINTDGSFFPTSNEAGAGLLCRNATGVCLFFLLMPCDAQDAITSECFAILLAAFCCSKLRNRKWIIETDNESLFLALSGKSPPPWEVTYIIRRIHKLLEGNIIFWSHTRRQGNRPANALARVAAKLDFACLDHLIPPRLNFLLKGDLLNLPFLRPF